MASIWLEGLFALVVRSINNRNHRKCQLVDKTVVVLFRLFLIFFMFLSFYVKLAGVYNNDVVML